MRKIILMISASFMLGAGIQAQTGKGQPDPASTQSIVNASLSGPANVCPNDQNVLYTSSTNFSGPTYWVEFKCGGAGVIAESGTQSYIINNTGNSNSCHVNWGNYNGSASWVQVVYHWTVVFLNYTATATQNTYIGVGPPTGISGPSSLCANDLSNFTVTCPNSIPANAYAYQWTASNAAIVSGNTSSTATMHAVNGLPITVYVKFASYCGGYSGTYSYTISRLPSLPLGAGYVLQHLESMGVAGNLLVDFTFPSKPYSYNWHAVVTEPSATPVNYTGTVPANTTGYTQISLVNTGATIYMNANYGNESCGNYWNYAYGRSGLNEGAHNRMAHSGADGNMTSANNNLLVYPNPASDHLTITGIDDKASPVALAITDVLGNTVLSEERTFNEGEEDLQIQLPVLKSGVYFLNISQQGVLQTKKIVIGSH